MSTNECGKMADLIVDALDIGESGAVRGAVDDHLSQCSQCGDYAGVLIELAAGLDPVQPPVSQAFVARVMNEVRSEESDEQSAYDRLPPPWQVAGALVLLVTLSAVVLATGGGDAWHQQVITGYLEEALRFLAGLSQAIQGLWDAVVPGKGLPILIACAFIATVLNIGFVVAVWRRKKRTID